MSNGSVAGCGRNAQRSLRFLCLSINNKRLFGASDTDKLGVNINLGEPGDRLAPSARKI